MEAAAALAATVDAEVQDTPDLLRKSEPLSLVKGVLFLRMSFRYNANYVRIYSDLRLIADGKEVKTNMKNNMVLWGIIALLILGGGWLLVSGRNIVPPAENTMNQPTASESEDAMMDDDDIDEVDDIDENDEDDDGLITVEVEGGMFYFKPNEIRVTEGEPVRIVFKSVEGMHDFTIDDLNVKTEQISANNTTEVTFTPEKVGTFEFYCSVGNHRAMGMTGKLIVE